MIHIISTATVLSVNFLAHVFLANAQPAAIVGQLCGDFVRGSKLNGFSAPVEAAIRHHRAVDTFTDRHPLNAAARGLFSAPHRRFAGIIVDVVYDHFLATDWSKYCDTPLEQYVDLVHQSLAAHQQMLPENLKRFAPVLRAERILQNNKHREHVDLTLGRLSQRRPSMRPLATASPSLWRNEVELKRTFDAFFPELITFSETRNKH